jgi:hypothetical protein
VRACADNTFRGFSGGLPPVLISAQSFATFHNCTFEDINLQSELVDVSNGGLVRIEDCLFHNVLSRKLVSTTANDFSECSGDYIYGVEPVRLAARFLPDDDLRYDIKTEPLPGGQPGEYYVKNETLSDCLFHRYSCIDLSLKDYQEIPHPGCPEASVAKRIHLHEVRCKVDYATGAAPTPRDYSYGPIRDYDGAGDPPGIYTAYNAIAPSPYDESAYAPSPYKGSVFEPPADYPIAPGPLRPGFGCYGPEGFAGSGYQFGFISEGHVWLRTLRQVRPCMCAIASARACGANASLESDCCSRVRATAAQRNRTAVQMLPVHSGEGRGTWSWPNATASQMQEHAASHAAPAMQPLPHRSFERPEAVAGY